MAKNRTTTPINYTHCYTHLIFMIHIIPLNDLKVHEELSTCACKPKIIEENSELICIHNAFDKREKVELLTENLNLN